MPPSTAAIGVIIRARDEASAVVARTMQSVVTSTQRAQETLSVTASGVIVRAREEASGVAAATEQSFARSAKAVRSLAVPVANELAPAFGAVTAQITNVVTSAALLGTGIGALAVGAAGLASIVVGQLVSAWTKAAEAQRSYAEAMTSFDPAVQAAQIAKENKELDALNKELDDVTESLARLQAQQQAGGPGTLAAAIQRGRGAQLEERRAAIVGRLGDVAARQQANQQARDFARAEEDGMKAAAEFVANRNRIINEGTQREIEARRQAALVAIQADRQVAELSTDRLRASEALLAAEERRITATRDAELRALSETAAARQKAIADENAARVKGGAVSTAAEEQLQLERTIADQRAAITKKAEADLATARARSVDEERQRAEQVFQIRRTLGEATLQDEIDRYLKIAAAADAGSRAQIEAAGRAAAAIAQQRQQESQALDEAISKAEELARAKAQAAGLGAEATAKALARAPVSTISTGVTDLMDLQKAQVAKDILAAGGTVSALEARLVQQIPQLRERTTARARGTPEGLTLPALEGMGRGLSDQIIQTIDVDGITKRFVVVGESAGAAFSKAFTEAVNSPEVVDKFASALADVLEFQGARHP